VGVGLLVFDFRGFPVFGCFARFLDFSGVCVLRVMLSGLACLIC